jgi:hypothetical protein
VSARLHRCKLADGRGLNLVCRVLGNRDLFGDDDDTPELGSGMTDEELFLLADTNGSGTMTLGEFAAYMGGSVDDASLAAKFDA